MMLLFRKEILSAIYSAKYVLVAFLLICMSIVITTSQALDFKQQIETINAVADNIDYNKQVTYIFPMSIHINGVQNFLAAPIGVGHTSRIYFDENLTRADDDNLFRRIDLHWLNRVIVSLCALFLTYGSLCGEKRGL